MGSKENLNSMGDGSIWSYSDNDGGFSKKVIERIQRRAQETKLLLEKTGGVVICFLRDKGKILNCAPNVYKQQESRIKIHRYSWIPESEFRYSYKRSSQHSGKIETLQDIYRLSPQYFSPDARIGKEFSSIDKIHPFSQYFSALKDNLYFEVVINNSALLKVSKPIAKNKVGEVVALEIPFGQGKLTFLPLPTRSADIKKVAGVLVDCVRKSLQWTSPLSKPDWIKDYRLPEESNLMEEINKVDEKLKEATREKEIVQKKINEMELLKGLLYESGKYGLEPAVRSAFRIIGFNVLEPEKYDKEYDLFAEEGEIFVIGEIEGSSSQVDVEKLRQLLQYVSEATLEGKKCKGILIGNGYMNIEPSKRKEQFTEHAIKGCDNQKYCRITTIELCKAVNAVLSDPQNQELKNLIKENILKCESEFKFKDYSIR